ncbi:MAG: OmpA family protein [Paludibacteraceae bacterium]|nr:OmpA family protein [Paludibacteraceae bacterium]
MKKILFALCCMATMCGYAAERAFLEGYTVEPSRINNDEAESGLSLLKNKLAFSRGGKVYVATLNDSLDVESIKEQSDLSALGIEGQFAQYNNQLIFSSKGVLYCATQKNNVWGNPEKLMIDGFMSTREQEEGTTFISRRWTYKKKPAAGMYNPAFGNKGKRIYFSSQLEGGRGGSDIWYIERKPDNKTWFAPKNMPDVNSERNEDFPQLVGDTMFYFSSDRADSLKGSNIFKKLMKGKFAHAPQMVVGQFNSDANDKNFVVAENVPFLISNRAGGDDIYRPNLLVPEPEPVDTTPVDTTPQLKVVRKDFRTCIFYFEYDKTSMIDSYEAEFKYICDFINEDSTSIVQITGYTDERGTVEYNMTLSKDRANVVFDRLVKMGVNAKRLRFDGKGKSNPVVPNAQTEADHQKNRRVEIVKLENDEKDDK